MAGLDLILISAIRTVQYIIFTVIDRKLKLVLLLPSIDFMGVVVDENFKACPDLESHIYQYINIQVQVFRMNQSDEIILFCQSSDETKTGKATYYFSKGED